MLLIFTQGASILRMLEDWMGKEKFRDGCRVSQTALLLNIWGFFYLFIVGFFLLRNT